MCAGPGDGPTPGPRSTPATRGPVPRRPGTPGARPRRSTFPQHDTPCALTPVPYSKAVPVEKTKRARARARTGTSRAINSAFICIYTRTHSSHVTRQIHDPVHGRHGPRTRRDSRERHDKSPLDLLVQLRLPPFRLPLPTKPPQMTRAHSQSSEKSSNSSWLGLGLGLGLGFGLGLGLGFGFGLGLGLGLGLG